MSATSNATFRGRMRVDEPNDSVCTLTKLFRDNIAFVDNEVLVEDLEDLAAL